MAEASYDLSRSRATPINGRIIAIAASTVVDRGDGGADPRRSLRPRGVGFRFRPRRRLSHRPRTNSACRLRFADRRADTLSDLSGRTDFSRRAAVHRPARAGVAHHGAAVRRDRARIRSVWGFAGSFAVLALVVLVPYTLDPTMLSEISYFATYNRFATAILFLAGLWLCCQKPAATACCWATC